MTLRNIFFPIFFSAGIFGTSSIYKPIHPNNQARLLNAEPKISLYLNKLLHKSYNLLPNNYLSKLLDSSYLYIILPQEQPNLGYFIVDYYGTDLGHIVLS